MNSSKLLAFLPNHLFKTECTPSSPEEEVGTPGTSCERDQTLWIPSTQLLMKYCLKLGQTLYHSYNVNSNKVSNSFLSEHMIN